MKRRYKLLNISEEEQTKIINWVLEGKTISKYCKKEGWDRMQFLEYRQAYPLFEKDLQQARRSACENLEENLLTLHETEPDPQMLRVRSDNIKSVLNFRDPAQYGTKMQIDVNQHVDLSVALRAADERLALAMKDVNGINNNSLPASNTVNGNSLLASNAATIADLGIVTYKHKSQCDVVELPNENKNVNQNDTKTDALNSVGANESANTNANTIEDLF